jgi:hypothetical protein
MPAIANACSLQPRRALAPRDRAPRYRAAQLRAAQIAPRDSRRAIRATQPRLHTAPILQRPPCTTSSSDPPSYSLAAFVVNSEPTPGRVPRSVCVWGPSLLAVFIKSTTILGWRSVCFVRCTHLVKISLRAHLVVAVALFMLYLGKSILNGVLKSANHTHKNTGAGHNF